MNSRDEEFINRLIMDYPEVKFRKNSSRFSYQLRNGIPTVFLGEPQPNYSLLTLHELGHGLLKHKDYKVDVGRIKIESAAWERAKTVLLKYHSMAFDEDGKVIDKKLARILPEWDEDFVQEKLDTYRDWLHARSRCKKCGLTGYQTEDGTYHCPRCEAFILAR